MATLKVENFPDELYERLRALAVAERRSLAAQVVYLLERAVESSERLSILELRGLGKGHWCDTSATEHVRRERGGWI